MKKLYIALSFILFISNVYAQNQTTEKADGFFNSFQYVNAINEYLKIADSKSANQYVYTQLANSYYNVFNAAEASKWYAKAVEKEAVAETYYKYAQSLKFLSKYVEANKQMAVFAKLLPNDSRAKAFLLDPNYIPSIANKSKLFDVAETKIKNNGQSDFGAFLTNENELYFASTRNKATKTDKWTNQPYLDIYKSVIYPDGTASEPIAVSELNTPFHDGPVCITADGNTAFFARDSHSEGQYQKSKSANIKIGQQGIYKATKVDNKWTHIESLPINSTEFSNTNPALSNDGKTLFYASNMPGGYGESDIWKISVDGNNYGKPENLGALVNSADKENFPSIDKDVLYFSTSGRNGFGGLDIYKVDLKDNKGAINVGSPVNTEKDDFSFSMNSKLNIAYFSSNRNGFDALYSATPICSANLIATITNKKTGAILPNASVSILDSKNNIIATKESDSEGKVNYLINCNTEYVLAAKTQNFDPTSIAIPKIKTGIETVSIALDPTEIVITETEVILKNVYFDFNKSNITELGSIELDKLVTVMKQNPTMVIFVKSHTDTKGLPAYNLNLSEQRAQSTVQYIISKGIINDRISGKGFGSTEPKINCIDKCTEEEDAQNRRSEFMIVKK